MSVAQARVQRLDAAQRAHEKAKFTTTSSLAWRQRPELLPRPGSGSTRRQPVNVGGDLPAVEGARSAQQQDLRAQVATLRSQAAGELARARVELGDRVTMAEWSAWFADHSSAFDQLRKEATQKRRALSRRLRADPTLPRCPRAPPAPHADVREALSPWQLLLRGRSGWHSYRLAGRLHVVYLCRHANTTWVVDLTRVGTWQQRVVCIPYDAKLSTAMQPLAHLPADAAGSAAVFEIAISAKCAADHIEVSFLDRQQLTAELRPPAKGSRQRSRPDHSDAESGSSGSSGANTEAELPSHRSEDSDGLPEVETDLETEVEEPGQPSSSGSDADGPSAASAPPRHGPGTWTVFRNFWWLVSSNPAFADVRINLTSDMVSAGLGVGVQKQLTPKHFGESKPNVPVTVLLLRCWSIWRARQSPAWLADQAHPYRPRELREQVRALRQDLLEFHAALAPGTPFLRSPRAQGLARDWVADLVEVVTQRASGAK